MEQKNTKEYAQEWIEKGNPCIYRYGWGWKGGRVEEITKEKALELLPQYRFGKGFYTLSFIYHEGKEVLEFNELSVNDMY